MNLENFIFESSHWHDIDLSSLDSYNWKTWEEGNSTRYGRLPYSHRRPEWESDTPEICLVGYKKSIEVLKKINKNCNIVSLDKCLILKVFKGNVLNQSNIHRDSGFENRWTVLWFLSGDGNTSFYKDLTLESKIKEIQFETGKAAIFPSQIYHAPGFPIEQEPRIVINYVFHVENLLETNIPRPKCTCGHSKDYPYCDLTHNKVYNIR